MINNIIRFEWLNDSLGNNCFQAHVGHFSDAQIVDDLGSCIVDVLSDCEDFAIKKGPHYVFCEVRGSTAEEFENYTIAAGIAVEDLAKRKGYKFALSL